MYFKIYLTKCAHLECLLLPFPATVRVARGNVSLRRKPAGFEFARSAQFAIPALVEIELAIWPDSSGAAEVCISLADNIAKSNEEKLVLRLCEAMCRPPAAREVSQELAAAVFLNPNVHWSVALVASMAATTPRRVQQRLLREGHCLREIVVQQTQQRKSLEHLARGTTNNGRSSTSIFVNKNVFLREAI